LVGVGLDRNSIQPIKNLNSRKNNENRGILLRRRRLLIGSIITIAIGFILWMIVGPVIAVAGAPSHWEGWWHVRIVVEYTTLFWVGLIVSAVGLIILVAGLVVAVLAIMWEISDRQKVQ